MWGGLKKDESKKPHDFTLWPIFFESCSHYDELLTWLLLSALFGLKSSHVSKQLIIMWGGLEKDESKKPHDFTLWPICFQLPLTAHGKLYIWTCLELDFELALILRRNLLTSTKNLSHLRGSISKHKQAIWVTIHHFFYKKKQKNLTLLYFYQKCNRFFVSIMTSLNFQDFLIRSLPVDHKTLIMNWL